MKRDENGKPLIRHCKNCKWYGGGGWDDCQVRYREVLSYRLRALFCKFFEMTTKPYHER